MDDKEIERGNVNLEYAHRCFKQGDANHWSVARIASQTKIRRDVIQLAEAIERTDDTVRNLSDAYNLFRELILAGKVSEPIRRLRRRFPYTRWAIIYRQWMIHEFSLEEAKDWLENFHGGNDAMSAEIENKHGAPEFERRACSMYRQAQKLSTDFGVPERLQAAAVHYVKEFDVVFPKVNHEHNRKAD
jgi:hypothetical protein